jgi:hypothetical protein
MRQLAGGHEEQRGSKVHEVSSKFLVFGLRDQSLCVYYYMRYLEKLLRKVKWLMKTETKPWLTIGRICAAGYTLLSSSVLRVYSSTLTAISTPCRLGVVLRERVRFLCDEICCVSCYSTFFSICDREFSIYMVQNLSKNRSGLG